jgi:hypothetical protein
LTDHEALSVAFTAILQAGLKLRAGLRFRVDLVKPGGRRNPKKKNYSQNRFFLWAKC